jgi:hypothetical protein
VRISKLPLSGQKNNPPATLSSGFGGKTPADSAVVRPALRNKMRKVYNPLRMSRGRGTSRTNPSAPGLAENGEAAVSPEMPLTNVAGLFVRLLLLYWNLA